MAYLISILTILAFVTASTHAADYEGGNFVCYQDSDPSKGLGGTQWGRTICTTTPTQPNETCSGLCSSFADKNYCPQQFVIDCERACEECFSSRPPLPSAPPKPKPTITPITTIPPVVTVAPNPTPDIALVCTLNRGDFAGCFPENDDDLKFCAAAFPDRTSMAFKICMKGKTWGRIGNLKTTKIFPNAKGCCRNGYTDKWWTVHGSTRCGYNEWELTCN